MTDLRQYQRILRLPRVTERGTADQEKHNAFHFLVAPEANKIQVRQAVEKVFGVKVLSVNTMNRKGKLRSLRTRRGISGWRESGWKKAIVKLKPGDTINFQ